MDIKIPPHLAYVATLPCETLISVSQMDIVCGRYITVKSIRCRFTKYVRQMFGISKITHLNLMLKCRTVLSLVKRLLAI